MELVNEDGKFKTEMKDGVFIISITRESDWLVDGGYTFEDVTNSFMLSNEEAIKLCDELGLNICWGVR